jgi:iron complex outermembrane recepter protein
LLARWQATTAWRISAGYSWLETDFDQSLYVAGTSPRHQGHLRSSLQLGRGWELDSVAYYVGQIKALRMGSPAVETISAYVRLDVGLNWRPNDRVELALWGQNLLDNSHPEFAQYKSQNIAEIPRSLFGRIAVRF